MRTPASSSSRCSVITALTLPSATARTTAAGAPSGLISAETQTFGWAFGVFYLSLGVTMLVLVADRAAEAFLVYMRAGLVLVAFILAATAAYAGTFELSAHPFPVLYPLAYVVALVGSTASLVWERRRRAAAVVASAGGA